MPKYTPAMQQYIDMKKDHKDCVLFFRMGDFYETFFEDAKIASRVLDIILTSRDKRSDNPIPMAGIPYHSVEKYISKLIQSGYKVAIAEQLTQPVPGKIVAREVVQVITPATYIQDNSDEFNFIVAINFSNQKDGYDYHIAWGDFSVGEYSSKSFDNMQDIQKFIFSLNPRELIIDIDFPDKDELENNITNYTDCLISLYDQPVDVEKYILQQCKVQTLSSFGKALTSGRQYAFALLLHYLNHTQKSFLTNIVRVRYHSTRDVVLLDDVTIKNLEIFQSSYENNEQYSLFGVINNTRTSAGARYLRYLLFNPTKDIKLLNNRLDHIEYYRDDIDLSKRISAHMGSVFDTHKLVSSILYRKLLAHSFVKLRANLSKFFSVDNTWILEELKRLMFDDNHIDDGKQIYNYLVELIQTDEDIELQFRSNDIGSFIKDGFDPQIDDLRKVAYHSDELLLEYQKEVADVCGISTLRLKFVKNQGYFLEVTNKDIDKLEQSLQRILLDSSYSAEKFHLVRRQTLKGSQRYVSEYLEEIQHKILQARENLVHREMTILEEAKVFVSEMVDSLHEFANYISYLDVYTSFAILSRDLNLVRPNLFTKGNLDIQEGRHLVIEKYLENNQSFIPNTLRMGSRAKNTSPIQSNGEIHIITGPNMGGKSTYLRQNALIVLMSHCGFFVPCKQANIGLVDGIFARVGSGDIIAKNQSTFLTEMIEVANILNNATEHSFVIFDELGRGTSTYDGLALTRAILEYIAMEIKCNTLIATHYHELTELENYYDSIRNFSVSVYETDKEVVFTKKIIPGGANKSYGVDVAKIAGITPVILEQAWKYLQGLEKEKKGDNLEKQSLFQSMPSRFTKSDPKLEKIKAMLETIDINNITPVQALALLEKIKGDL